MISTPDARQKSCIVVLVEDEFLIRMVAVDALTDAGFTVIEAEHAAEALSTLAARHAETHVLFTDVHLPGQMNGLELAQHVREHWPWIALLVTSGHARPRVIDLPVGCRFLPKPYVLDHVVAHIRELTAT